MSKNEHACEWVVNINISMTYTDIGTFKFRDIYDTKAFNVYNPCFQFTYFTMGIHFLQAVIPQRMEF